MIRKSRPVARLMKNPPMAHGMNAFTSLSATPRKKPINRKSSSPAPPIKTQSPRKCSDSHAGHNHDIPNSALESAVDSNQVEKSAMDRVPLLEVRHQPAGDDGDDPEAERPN